MFSNISRGRSEQTNPGDIAQSFEPSHSSIALTHTFMFHGILPKTHNSGVFLSAAHMRSAAEHHRSALCPSSSPSVPFIHLYVLFLFATELMLRNPEMNANKPQPSFAFTSRGACIGVGTSPITKVLGSSFQITF